MQDIKATVAKNIASLRKSVSLTQTALAERLNYSDKAVSKWERAESLPDITTLMEIADLFGVKLDDLVRAETVIPAKNCDAYVFRRSRVAVASLAVFLVWFCAVVAFILFNLFPNFRGEWLSFIFAVPLSSVVWLIFNTIWFRPRLNYLIISIMMWSTLLGGYLTAFLLGTNLWQLFLLGIPGQIIIVIWSCLRVKVK